jgi:hypothetical protein
MPIKKVVTDQLLIKSLQHGRRYLEVTLDVVGHKACDN